MAYKLLCVALIILIMAFFMPADTTYSAHSLGVPFFVEDQNASGDPHSRDRIKVGVADYQVSDRRRGLTDSGCVSATADPLGTRGRVYKLTATPASNFAANAATFDRVDLWNEPKPIADPRTNHPKYPRPLEGRRPDVEVRSCR
jgi:hypothetical protein